MSVRLKELREVFTVVSDIVCKVGGNVFEEICYWKCVLLGFESRPIFWSVVCLCASDVCIGPWRTREVY